MDNMEEAERPDERVLLVWRLSNTVGYGIFMLLVGIAAILAWFFIRFAFLWTIGAVATVGLLWVLSAIVLRKQWENWRFRVTPEALEMAHGWIWRHHRIVARDRIQHVDINSGPFDRRFGLVQVVVHTAGTTVGMIPGLAPERASLLRDQLMEGRAVE